MVIVIFFLFFERIVIFQLYMTRAVARVKSLVFTKLRVHKNFHITLKSNDNIQIYKLIKAIYVNHIPLSSQISPLPLSLENADIS